jgi:hypothetical protein
MASQAEASELRAAVAAVVREQAAAERYRLRQRQARRGGTEAYDRPGPLEFDESGFPVPQTSPGFGRRLARLLDLP